MCQLSKMENMTAIKLKKSGSRSFTHKPAFQGAKFDKHGYCLHHPSVQLANPTRDDTGKIVYQELKATCPSCQSAKHKSNKTTSLSGGKVKQGHRLHGAPTRSSRSPSRSRSMSRERGNNGQPLERRSSASSRSKSRDRIGKPRRPEYDTPFDSKGRCHHHKNVQLAARKITGGWKVLHSVCPKCIEAKFEDDRSVRSGSTRRSARSDGSGSLSGAVRGNAHGKFDKNGCCVLHTHIQVAKKRVFGTGFKVIRACPACEGGDDGTDDYSVRSSRSASSRKSTRSVQSSTRPGEASRSGRYGALPFDGDGYCCRHPNVQLARRKALGGFKIILGVCPACALEDGGGARSGRRKKPSRRGSGTGRVFDDSGSEASSFKSGKSGKSGLTSGGGSSSKKKKRIRVKNLRTVDDEGKVGRYFGDVNEDYQPHGNGVMKYADGTVYDGVWSEGSRVHGKMKKGRQRRGEATTE